MSSDRLFFLWPEGQRICDNKMEVRDLKSVCSCKVITLHVDYKIGTKQGRKIVPHA